jgi:hypothetical protein
VCIICSGSVEGLENQFDSRGLNIQDWEVAKSQGEKGGGYASSGIRADT